MDDAGPDALPAPTAKPVALRVHRDDATVWVWICYGLAQAIITMLMVFDVVDTLTAAEVTTAVTFVIYVAVNELIVRPRRRRWMIEHAIELDVE